ncbi:unnamed protein product [Parnassius apollo]|uniref:(apollo) hypothetical protein n=1 Tax=Parnassius apollo TaxID=110799 RepID=A0A8S3Y6T9_PARAO|nr:unnamed protein product [Parnassius apollo]
MMSRGKKLVSLVAVNCEKVSENEQSSHAGLVDIQEIQSTSYNNADAIDFHHSQIHDGPGNETFFNSLIKSTACCSKYQKGEDSDDNVETELESLFGDVFDADDPTYRLPIFSHQLENENSNNLVTLEDLLGNKENFNAEKFDVEHIQNNIEVFDQGYEQHREITAIIEDILDEVFKKAWLLIEPLKRWRKSDPSSWARNVVKKKTSRWKDQCLICTNYAKADTEKKRELEDDYLAHQERKKICNREKEKDKVRSNTDEHFSSVTFDLQAVLQIPASDVDTCGGQNRNQFVAALLLWAVQKIDHLKVIEQKFLESGHTQMEADSMHSSIEFAKKNTSVFSMMEWISIFKRARRRQSIKIDGKKMTREPYHVKEFKYDEFLDLKHLAGEIMKK